MADVFINYCREDIEIAQRIAALLEAKQISLFWDRVIPTGKTFTEVIKEALEAAKCVITIWSKNSVHSEWVMAEADYAAKQNKLLPIAIGKDLKIPLGFRTIQTEFIDESSLSTDKWLSILHRGVKQYLADSAERLAQPSRKPGGHRVAESPKKDLSDLSRDRSKERKKAFISYADEDEEFAIDLVRHLESSGCPCWISFRDVDPGDDYRASITRAMDEIAFLVLIYSERVNTSFDIATELILARKRGKRRFVLRTDSTEPAGPVEYELVSVQWLDCQTNREAAFEKISKRAELL